MKYKRVTRRIAAGALFLVTLLAGCRLWQAPIYPRSDYASGVRPLHILFIGNSLTYYNDLPGLVGQLSAGEAQPLRVDSVTLFNATLQDHWTITAARKHLERGLDGDTWDFVVLQEYSTRPAESPTATLADYRLWANEIHRLGPAKIVLFENWTHEQQSDLLARMRDTYTHVQREIGGDIALIGDAWERCGKQHPEIKLYDDDKHPTVAGTYLAACMLYKTVYRKPATGLPTVLPGLKLAPDIAAAMQHVADD